MTHNLTKKLKGLLVEEPSSTVPESIQLTSIDFENPYATPTLIKVNESDPLKDLSSGLIKVEDIYKKFDMSDKSKSIFKVEEIKDVLPSSMPKEVKKASVIGMMGVSKITIEEVLSDSEHRVEVLSTILQDFSSETIDIITSTDEEIKLLEQRIDSLKERITNRAKLQEDQEQLIDNEKKRINSIVAFIK